MDRTSIGKDTISIGSPTPWTIPRTGFWRTLPARLSEETPFGMYAPKLKTKPGNVFKG